MSCHIGNSIFPRLKWLIGNCFGFSKLSLRSQRVISFFQSFPQKLHNHFNSILGIYKRKIDVFLTCLGRRKLFRSNIFLFQSLVFYCEVIKFLITDEVFPIWTRVTTILSIPPNKRCRKLKSRAILFSVKGFEWYHDNSFRDTSLSKSHHGISFSLDTKRWNFETKLWKIYKNECIPFKIFLKFFLLFTSPTKFLSE